MTVRERRGPLLKFLSCSKQITSCELNRLQATQQFKGLEGGLEMCMWRRWDEQ